MADDKIPGITGANQDNGSTRSGGQGTTGPASRPAPSAPARPTIVTPGQSASANNGSVLSQKPTGSVFDKPAAAAAPSGGQDQQLAPQAPATPAKPATAAPASETTSPPQQPAASAAAESSSPEQAAAAGNAAREQLDDTASAPDIDADTLKAISGKAGSLLDCLEILTHIYEEPRSRMALSAGVPGAEGAWTASVFVRAAGRAGLAARVVRRPLAELEGPLLPAVVVTKDNQARLMLRKNDNGNAVVSSLVAPGGVEETSLADLKKDYSGFAILVRPAMRGIHAEQASDWTPTNWFWGAMAQNGWIYGQVALASILINLFALAAPLFIMTVYDRVIPNNAMETLWVLASGAMIVFLFDFIIKSLRSYFIDIAGTRADVLAASRIFNQIIDARMDDREQSPGRLGNTLKEFETLRDFITSASLAALVDLPFIILFFFIIQSVAGPLAWVLAGCVPIMILSGLIVQWSIRRLSKRSYEHGATKQSLIVEAASALETLKAVGGQGRIRATWETAVANAAQSSQASRFFSAVGVNFTQAVQQTATVVVVIWGVLLIQQGELSTGALIAAVIITGRALAPVTQIAGLTTRFNGAVQAYRAITSVMQRPVERMPGRKYLHRPVVNGQIEFRDVVFYYPGTDRQILKGVNFVIREGEKVGIIGRSGSGKTTLQRLLMGIYQPQAGAVLVDGTDVRQFDPVDLRANIGSVPQDSVLFKGTVRDNLILARPDVDDATVLDMAKVSGVDDFVSQHPMGYDLPVGERGEGLSGGQRQSICVGRALLLDPPILLMDEPTSHMDNATEDQLRQRMEPVIKSRTVLLVTHRAAMLRLVDRVIVMDGGRVAMDGPRDQVIAALSGQQAGAI